jgi:hypothetical protein
VSFADRITAEATARGYVGRVLQILQAVAAYPEGCFEYVRNIATSLPTGRLGKACHPQSVYRIFREHRELFERKRLSPGQIPPGGKYRLPNGGGHTRVNLGFLGLKTPRNKPTPRMGYNVKPESGTPPEQPIRLRHAVIELPEPVSVDPELAALALWASDPALPKPRSRSLAHNASAANSGPPERSTHRVERPPDDS